MNRLLLIEKEEQLRTLRKYPHVFPLMIKKLEREIKELKGTEEDNEKTNQQTI